jgi:hypothetical protein
MMPIIKEAAANGEHLIQEQVTNGRRHDATRMRKFDETQQKK